MRHDPAGGAIIMLRSLKMHGMAVVPQAHLWRDPSQTRWSEPWNAIGPSDNGQRAPAFDTAVPMLARLLKAEIAEREVRSIHCPPLIAASSDCRATGQCMFTCTRGASHMKAARFPACKDLSGFDFAASEINEATVRQLHRCEVLDGAQNVVLIHCPAGYWSNAREGVAPARAKTGLRPFRAKTRQWRVSETPFTPCCDSAWRAGRRTSSPQGPLLLDHRARQHARTGEGQGQSRTACRQPRPH